jgi:hypothetical protein
MRAPTRSPAEAFNVPATRYTIPSLARAALRSNTIDSFKLSQTLSASNVVYPLTEPQTTNALGLRSSDQPTCETRRMREERDVQATKARA